VDPGHATGHRCALGGVRSYVGRAYSRSHVHWTEASRAVGCGRVPHGGLADACEPCRTRSHFYSASASRAHHLGSRSQTCTSNPGDRGLPQRRPGSSHLSCSRRRSRSQCCFAWKAYCRER
jgi:hypothetical protein